MRHTEETLALHENLEENRRLCYTDFTTFCSEKQTKNLFSKTRLFLEHQRGNWHCSKSYRARRLYITWLVVDKLESMESLRLGKCGHTPLATDKKHLHACTTKDHNYLKSITKQSRFLDANWLRHCSYCLYKSEDHKDYASCNMHTFSTENKVNSPHTFSMLL